MYNMSSFDDTVDLDLDSVFNSLLGKNRNIYFNILMIIFSDTVKGKSYLKVFHNNQFNWVFTTEFQSYFRKENRISPLKH